MPQTALQPLFESYTGQQLGQVQELPSSGSNRRYFRLSGGNVTLIGVIGTSKEENRAFIALSRHFREKGLHVPAVLAVSEDSLAYIQEDLGDQVLFDLVSQGRESGIYSSYETGLLRRTIEQLPRIQFLGGKGLDWSVCFPQEAFDARMIDFGTG